jgi:hypothetical protein
MPSVAACRNSSNAFSEKEFSVRSTGIQNERHSEYDNPHIFANSKINAQLIRPRLGEHFVPRKKPVKLPQRTIENPKHSRKSVMQRLTFAALMQHGIVILDRIATNIRPRLDVMFQLGPMTRNAKRANLSLRLHFPKRSSHIVGDDIMDPRRMQKKHIHPIGLQLR